MSRTDKDRPWWVRHHDRSDDALVEHHMCGRSLWKRDFHECDINEPAQFGEDNYHCRRIPSSMRGWGYGPSPDDRRIDHQKRRTQARINTVNYIKQYREYGDVDDEMPFQQSIIHFPEGGGYWD